ncbi:MAG: class I SAM-dependent methyltransferase [Gammaproteobacteria bacterium]
MDNYEFCALWALEQEHGDGMCVLDFGCGAGQIVDQLRAKNVRAFGCDVFFEGNSCLPSVPRRLMGSVIRRMQTLVVPFESGQFDVVINNQVMEHVEDLDSALSEIHRVLKPKGVVLSLFPDKGVWREGHCGIPFLHWFPKGSRTRLFYAAALRLLGLGYDTGNKGVVRWAKEWCDWLDMWTYYRKSAEIRSAYATYFVKTRHIEDYWLQRRLGTRKGLVKLLPARAQRLMVRKLAGLVFVCSKPGHEGTDQRARRPVHQSPADAGSNNRPVGGTNCGSRRSLKPRGRFLLVDHVVATMLTTP